MIRMEFNTYDDGSYFFLYVTEEVRIETNGSDGLQMETRDSRVRDLGDPFQYLTIKERKDEYFNKSILNPLLDVVLRAVQVLYNIIRYNDNYLQNKLIILPYDEISDRFIIMICFINECTKLIIVFDR
nr:MAG TPA: hypothetical protein [Caudoviricetes sp.]